MAHVGPQRHRGEKNGRSKYIVVVTLAKPRIKQTLILTTGPWIQSQANSY